MPRHYAAADPAAPVLVFAHGAGAGHDHAWGIRVAKGLAARGVHVLTFNFPYIERGRSVPDPASVLEAAFVDIWKGAGARFAGGKSMGGRMASQVAAKHVRIPPIVISPFTPS